MNKTWIFDLDDTLIANQHCYDWAIIDFLMWISWAVPNYRRPNIQAIVNMLVDIDHAGVATNGFGMERFPTSCAKTYDKICEILKIEPEDSLRERAYKIGMTAFSPEWNYWVDEAENVLKFLDKQGDALILLTKGDEQVQNPKIDKFELKKYFSKISIVPEKTKDVFLNTAIGSVLDSKKTLPLNNIITVGNGIKSDIIPSLDAGLKTIYVPCETWQFEKQHTGLPENNKLIVIDKISEIIDIYKILDISE